MSAIEDRRASLEERRYIAARLRSDGIEPNVDPRTERFDIPVVIADLEILRVYDANDERMGKVLQDHPSRMMISGLTDEQVTAIVGGPPVVSRRPKLAWPSPPTFIIGFASGWLCGGLFLIAARTWGA